MAGLIAILATMFYSGAAAYIAFVEHPARLACSTETAWAQWRQSVGRTPRYAASALVAAAGGLIQGRLAPSSLWTWGALLLLGIVPFTVGAMLPSQGRLTAATWDPAQPDTRPLLERWGRQHAVRLWLGVVALVVFLLAARP